MKRLLSLVLIVAMVLTLVACGKATPKEEPTPTTTAEDATTTTATGSTDAEDTTTTAGDTTATGDTTTSHPIDKTTVPKDPTTTGGGEDAAKSIRVLAIGDGMAVDAMQTHLYGMLKGCYDTVQLGVLYADKSSLDTHHAAVKNDTKSYEFRQTTDGKWNKEAKVAPSKALKAADWDYVVIQQSAADSGVPATYGKLKELTALIKKQCSDALIYWHMTWAYQQDSKAEGFLNYYRNQPMMFQSIINTALQQVMRDSNIWGLIPTATAIQNLRTSTLGDALTTDGIHLTDTYGDYAAALTWFCALTEEEADAVTYRPDAVKEHLDEILEAVGNAVSIPNAVTPSKNGDGEHKSIRILAVGNSFSVDAMNRHLYQMFEAAGYDEIRLGILYVGGCSIDQHYNFIKNNSGSYQYQENVNGTWTYTENYKAADAFALTQWDVITVQQVSGYSGIPSSYGNLDALMALIKAKSGNAKIYWQMTWAYEGDSTHGDFGKYGKDQMKMYNAIVSTVQEKIASNPDFDGILPSGTAIQNLRTSTLGDTLTADGYHLENTYGDYTASLTWYCTLTGESAYATSYCPSAVVDHFHEIAEAVDSAIEKPFEVTESNY